MTLWSYRAYRGERPVWVLVLYRHRTDPGTTIAIVPIPKRIAKRFGWT